MSDIEKISIKNDNLKIDNKKFKKENLEPLKKVIEYIQQCIKDIGESKNKRKHEIESLLIRDQEIFVYINNKQYKLGKNNKINVINFIEKIDEHIKNNGCK